MIEPGTEQDFSSLNNHSSPADKIACFRSLFRGRSDVYPQRFESQKTGRAGYSPACSNEWLRGICEKPRIKCSNCLHQDWIPISERTLKWHLSGKDSSGKPFVMGIYPMLLDESCYFLAIDLDGEGWADDVTALINVAKKLNLPIAVERSRSGNGAHLWFFFEQAIPATQARRFGSHLLTEAMEARPEIGLGSYDRMFPNQDTLPKGGFGNLIALPLQKTARDLGNSLFLDEALDPIPDQWTFLAQLPKVSLKTITSIISHAEQCNRILPIRLAPTDEFALTPWRASPSRRTPNEIIEGLIPQTLEIVLSNQIYIPKAELPPALRNRILHLAAFQNPEFFKAQAMRLPTYDKPRIIACAEDHPEHIALPRGCLNELKTLFRSNKVRCTVKDLRETGTKLEVSFLGELRPEQITAAETMLAHDTGVLAATTAFGKTVLAAWLIAERGVNTLILVHRQQLMEQWVERLSTFLDYSQKSIGRLGGGRRKLRGQIDVALIQSMVRKDVVDDRIADYGQIIIDECHHLSAQSFERAVSCAKAKYVLGLSATVQRKDGHHPIIFMQCGPIRYRVDAKDQAKARPFQHHVIVRPTSFHAIHKPEEDARFEYQQLCQALMDDTLRNQLICSDITEAIKASRQPLVLTERTEHLTILKELLDEETIESVTLQGGMTKKQRAVAMKALESQSIQPVVLLATGRYVGEGFDCSRLDTLFVTMPVSWRGTIAQYVGRLHRLHDAKRVVQVYDYADLNVPMLERMFNKRCSGYEAVGYSIHLPASALPGWPQTVPLPIDPIWKKDYAASVKRLIIDGVEPTLAQLFVHAATPRNDFIRARSASEAFLYKRLETLAETRGRFRLNCELTIPFNQKSTMEVDFFCKAAKLVIELDGLQHLQDEAAWRSDRQKDLLLQMHGYLVIRFLTTDLSKELNAVLDSILAALEHCNRNINP
jgi:superfamily II DNA or RNA helicase/very-short-patch-repair endonuclease